LIVSHAIIKKRKFITIITKKKIKKTKRKYYLKRKEKILEKRKIYVKNHKKEISEVRKVYYQNHKEERKIYIKNNEKKILKNAKIYRKNHGKKISKTNKIWRENHKEEITKKRKIDYQKNKKEINKKARERRKTKEYKKSMNNYCRNKRKADIHFQIRCNLGKGIPSALKGKNKSISTMKLLGRDIDFFWNYLEAQFFGRSRKIIDKNDNIIIEVMTRHNYGKKGWVLDHIKPRSLFDLTDPAQIAMCFHYTNYQPLWAEDNLRKGNKYPFPIY